MKTDIISLLIYGLLGIGGLVLASKLLTKPSQPIKISTQTGKPSNSPFEVQNVPVSMFPSPYDSPNTLGGKFDYGSVANSLYTGAKKPGCGCGG